MCGIAGIIRFDGPRPGDGALIERMAALLDHRGPDDRGYLLASIATGQSTVTDRISEQADVDVLLASTRLAITDLTVAGHQPMTNETGDVVVVFNGAIHNHPELRAELEAFGHIFRSHSDTEVIAHAYEQWGAECANRFNGMWAYAIWDARHRRLVCSRDRFGVKPLLVAWTPDGCYLASEAKAILAAGVPATPDLAFIGPLLRPGTPCQGERTAFVGIEQVPAGHNLLINDGERRSSRYWSYSDRAADLGGQDPVAAFADVLDDAVRIRLRADVPAALLLSGGLDSSSLAVALQAAGASEGMTALTAVFPGYHHDERPHAELVARSVGMQHEVIEVDPASIIDTIRAVTWHMDAPPVLGQVVSRWHLLEAASRTVKVVLEGQGADEALGGYPHRYREPYLHSRFGLSVTAAVPKLLDAYGRRGRRSARRGAGRGQAGWAGLASPEVLAAERDAVGVGPDQPRLDDPLNEALHQDHARRILPHLLHHGDALSMAHSVEARLPFLDHRLVELAFALPFDQKVRGREHKVVLREAMGPRLPPAIRDRRDKVGFDTPLQAWLEPSRDDIRALLTSDRARARGVVDPGAIDRCLSGLETGERGAARAAFRAVALELWFQQMVDAPIG